MMAAFWGIPLLMLMLTGAAGWREDFSGADWAKGTHPRKNWQYDGGKFAVANTKFYARDGMLVIEARRSSGSLMTMPKADLHRYPILHWRWRVKNLPDGADGRDPKRDDQPAVLYFGSGGVLNRKVLAFRWENLMPIGHTGKVVYAGGIVTANYRCVRNHTSPLNEFVEEYVNIAELFRKVYGFLPAYNDYVISFGANSQYTKSHTVAEFDFIELVEGIPEKLSANTEVIQ